MSRTLAGCIPGSAVKVKSCRIPLNARDEEETGGEHGGACGL